MWGWLPRECSHRTATILIPIRGVILRGNTPSVFGSFRDDDPSKFESRKLLVRAASAHTRHHLPTPMSRASVWPMWPRWSSGATTVSAWPRMRGGITDPARRSSSSQAVEGQERGGAPLLDAALEGAQLISAKRPGWRGLQPRKSPLAVRVGSAARRSCSASQTSANGSARVRHQRGPWYFFVCRYRRALPGDRPAAGGGGSGCCSRRAGTPPAARASGPGVPRPG